MVAGFTDVALWVLFAAAIALIVYGCRMTRRPPKVVEDTAGAEFDRAA